MYSKRTLITQDRVVLTYFRWRTRDNQRPLLLLLHGLGSNHTRWLEFIEHSSINKQWDIIAPDLRGHSQSMVRGKINMETWAKDLLEILKQEKYRNAVIVGHSLGAHTALIFYKLFPNKVKGLVLIDPLCKQNFSASMRWTWRLRWITQTAIVIICFFNRLGIKRKTVRLRDLRTFDENARHLIAQGQQQEMLKHYSSPFVDLKYNPIANYLQYSLEVLRPLPSVKQNDLPLLLLVSGGSIYGNSDAQHNFTSQFTLCTKTIIDCNHWLLTEKPKEAREAIETWLSSTFQAS